MKRIMGLVLAILAFAVVAHADRIADGSAEYAARTGENFWSLAPSTETLQSSYSVKEQGKITLGTGTILPVSDDSERWIGNVFYSDFADSLKTSEGRVEFDSLRRRLNGFRGTPDDGREGSDGVDHTDPFRPVLAVAAVPEPETLFLAGMGLLAVWKRRSALR